MASKRRGARDVTSPEAEAKEGGDDEYKNEAEWVGGASFPEASWWAAGDESTSAGWQERMEPRTGSGEGGEGEAGG